MMEEKVEGLTIVVVGAWNPAIFTPQWIGGGRLTSATNVQMVFTVGAGFVGPEFTFDDVSLRIEPMKLTIRAGNAKMETLSRLGTTATKILEELSHTPVMGIGVNFQFIEAEPNPTLLGIFEVDDNDSIADGGGTIDSTSIVRKINFNNKTLNHVLQLHGGKVTFDMNFHFDIANCAAGVEKISPGVSSFRDEVLTFLRRIYKISLTP